MSKYIWGVLVLTVVLSASSCCEKRLYCESKPLDFAFTGFTKTEARSFILRRYAVDKIWEAPLDSARFVYTGATTISTKPDTLYFSDYSTTDDLTGVLSGNDWRIYMPATQQEFLINTIFENENNWEIVRCKDEGKTCSKLIRNFSVNNLWKDGSFTFLEKPDTP